MMYVKRLVLNAVLTEKQKSEAHTETGFLNKWQQKPEVGLVHALAVGVEVGLEVESWIPQVGPKWKHGHSEHVLPEHLKNKNDPF